MCCRWWRRGRQPLPTPLLSHLLPPTTTTSAVVAAYWRQPCCCFCSELLDTAVIAAAAAWGWLCSCRWCRLPINGCCQLTLLDGPCCPFDCCWVPDTVLLGAVYLLLLLLGTLALAPAAAWRLASTCAGAVRISSSQRTSWTGIAAPYAAGWHQVVGTAACYYSWCLLLLLPGACPCCLVLLLRQTPSLPTAANARWGATYCCQLRVLGTRYSLPPLLGTTFWCWLLGAAACHLLAAAAWCWLAPTRSTCTHPVVNAPFVCTYWRPPATNVCLDRPAYRYSITC